MAPGNMKKDYATAAAEGMQDVKAKDAKTISSNGSSRVSMTNAHKHNPAVIAATMKNPDKMGFKNDAKTPNLNLLFSKETIKKYAQSSPTLTHLQKYPSVVKVLNGILSIPFVSSTLSYTLLLSSRYKAVMLEAPRTPGIMLMTHAFIVNFLWKLDSLFNLLVLRNGVDAFMKEAHATHKSKIPGSWVVWFIVDYSANVVNTLLTEFIVRPFKKDKKPRHPTEMDETQTQGADNLEDVAQKLPHVQDLKSTAKGLTKDFNNKMKEDYIDPTYETVNKKDVAGDKSSSIPRTMTDMGHTAMNKLKDTTAGATDVGSKEAQKVAANFDAFRD